MVKLKAQLIKNHREQPTMKDETFNIKKKLDELDKIVDDMQNHELDIDQNLKAYEEAQKIIKQLEDKLAQVKEQIVKVVEKDEE